MHRKRDVLRWSIAPGATRARRGSREPVDRDSACRARCVRSRLPRAGISIGDTPFGAPLLGVKCGCNEAFIVEHDQHASWSTSQVSAHSERDSATVLVRAGERTRAIERDMLRPAASRRGHSPWRASPSAEAIIWTHDESGALAALPPHAAKWLARWRRRLAARSDARAGKAWWTLFRTPAASAGARARGLGRHGACAARAAPPCRRSDGAAQQLLRGSVRRSRQTRSRSPRCSTPHSPLRGCTCWPSRREVATIATSAGPLRSSRCRATGAALAALLAPLARRALDGNVPTACELLEAATRAYRLRAADVVAAHRVVQPMIVRARRTRER